MNFLMGEYTIKNIDPFTKKVDSIIDLMLREQNT